MKHPAYLEIYNYIVATESDKIKAASIAASSLLSDFLTGSIFKNDYRATLKQILTEAGLDSIKINIILTH